MMKGFGFGESENHKKSKETKMCLAVPMEVKEVSGNTAWVELEGIRREVRLDLLEPKPRPGDYVIVHAGFALHRIDEEEARESLKTWKEFLAHASQTPE
jgi:hydrogenase expression/formation protein HypC